MKKLIISAIAATSLLFGFASCSGDLHDVEDTPYVNNANAVYILGGISSSTMEDKVKATETAFADTKAYKVALDNDGNFKFTFTYSGTDSWSAGVGNTAFAIAADISNAWDGVNAARWETGSDGVSVGSETSLAKSNPTAANNAKITGLSAGTMYTVEGKLSAIGGTIKVTKGLSAVPFELIWIGADGNLTNAASATAENETTFTYEVTPEANEKELKFIARYGNAYYFPSSDETFTVDGTNADAASNNSSAGFKALKVTIPSKAAADKAHVSSYKLVFTLGSDKLTASVEKIVVSPYDITYINSSFGSKAISWSEPVNYGAGSNNGKPYINRKVYTGIATFEAGLPNGWGGSDFQFGVCTGNGDWSTKWTGAVLEASGNLYTLKNGASDNNKIEDDSIASPLTKNVEIKVTVSVYEGTFNNGKYSDSSEWAVSYNLK